MWRILCLAIAPAWVFAQSVPLSVLKIEENPGELVLRVRNLYNAPPTACILGYEVNGRVRVRMWWDLLLHASAEALAPGDARQFFHAREEEGGEWRALGAIFADGAVWGDSGVIRSILEDRQAVALQLARGMEILANPANPQALADQWFEESRHSQNQRFQLLPGTPPRVLPLGARMAVPRYLKMQFALGKSPLEILDSLRIWQRRLAAYRLDIAFV